MKVISVNVGLPRDVDWNGKVVATGIFKHPVAGRVRVNALNLEGDGQADLKVHGGVDKAVYVYPFEHYAYWRRELPGMELPWASFGENLTSEGLLEADVHIGDRLRIGSAEFAVTQPRMPCFKLGIRFGRPDMVKRFLRSRRSGLYLAVRGGGELGAGDAIVVIDRVADGLTVTDIVDLYTGVATDPALLRRAAETTALPAGWREYFRERMSTRDA